MNPQIALRKCASKAEGTKYSVEHAQAETSCPTIYYLFEYEDKKHVLKYLHEDLLMDLH